MTIFDTDVLTDLFNGVASVRDRAICIPLEDQAITAVSAGEVIRGQLNTIRQAEAGKGRIGLPRAYDMFLRSLSGLASMRILPFSSDAEVEFSRLKGLKLRVGSNDLRIASIAVTHDATLVTRNARDFGLVPGLLLEVWN